MLIDHWPLLGLELVTPRLRLRLPSSDELAALADLAVQGVHDPARMPFSSGWTDLPAPERARSVIQHQWRRQGEWDPSDWSLNLVVLEEGQPVGSQALAARRFPLIREVSSASWLGLQHQGRGIGTEMRAAVLHLAFDGLGAVDAVTGAFPDNDASLAVSRKLGYLADGVERRPVRGQVVVMQRLRLPRSCWNQEHAAGMRITGLAPCLPMFGLTDVDPLS
ncbi:GNAT family N-acetyltransferase [Kitasatospora sp. NPDC058032]|uniref:GNAT family N-acetyltransferase n=1 Tax=Kitasatospora sp. NPDC058032 TaxID=3346307 RepID=UPI0036D9384B